MTLAPRYSLNTCPRAGGGGAGVCILMFELVLRKWLSENFYRVGPGEGGGRDIHLLTSFDT